MTPESGADAAGGPLLVVHQLTTRLETPRGPLPAVDSVSLTVGRGRALGIVGESGSGKTVLVRSIMGLLPTRGTQRSGSVRFDGREIVGLPAAQMRTIWGKEMAMVFQDPMTSLNPLMRVGDQVAEPLRLHLGMSRREARVIAAKLLSEVRIPERRDGCGSIRMSLSGGMRQRVMIAIALACGPALILADEPTTALDVTVQAQILALLGHERRERNMSLVLVTHDLGVVAAHTDEIAVMYAGRIVERAPTARLFGQVRMPYTEALLRSIPRLDAPRHERLQVIPGRPPDLTATPPGCRFAPRCSRAEDRCRLEEPPLVAAEDDPDHHYACWFPVEAPRLARPGRQR